MRRRFQGQIGMKNRIEIGNRRKKDGMKETEEEEGESGKTVRGRRWGRGGEERRQKTFIVLHLDQGMTDNIPVDHLSGPLFDDKAQPASHIHYPLSLPEAKASIMLSLPVAAAPPSKEQRGPCP